MRRALVLGAIAALLVAGCNDGDGDEDAAPEREVGAEAPEGTWTPVAGQPFAEPPDVFQGTDVALTLDAKAQTISVAGQELAATPFVATPAGGQTLPAGLTGPTIHVSPGGTIRVTFVNSLSDKTNIHYHGLHVSPLGESDNVFRTFLPGETYQSVVQLPPDHPSGTYWYHVHFHGDSEMQVNGGLSGLLIVDGIEQSLPENLRGITDVKFALREVMTEGSSVITQEQRNAGGFTTTRLVNDLYQPALQMNQNDYQLWRFANIGPNAFYYRLGLEEHQFMIVAEDGNPVFDGKVTTADTLVMPPGKRYDVVVLGGDPGEYKLKATADDDRVSNGNPEITLATLTVGASDAAPSISPADITVNAPDDGLRQDRRPLAPPTPAGGGIGETPSGEPCPSTRCFTFGFTDNHFTINGERFDPNVLNVAVELGATETWTLYNTTRGPHPFHIHVNEFQVVSINGEPYDALGVQDIVAIPAMKSGIPGQVVIINQFLDYNGWFVFHCHILNHEDDGMMQSIEVLLPGQQPSPPPHDHDPATNGAARPRLSVG